MRLTAFAARARSLLVALSFALLASGAWAADAAEAEMEKASPLAVWSFLAIFVALIAGYFWMTWRSSKKEKTGK